MAIKTVPIGAAIKAAREAKGWSQRYLAERLGVSERAVQTWESGEKDPGFKKVQAMAKLFGWDLPFLGRNQATRV